MLLKEFSVRQIQQRLLQGDLRARLEDGFRQDLDRYHAEIEADSLNRCRHYFQAIKAHWRSHPWRLLQRWDNPKIERIGGVYVLVLDERQVNSLNYLQPQWYKDLYHDSCRLHQPSNQIHFEFLLNVFEPNKPKALELVEKIMSGSAESFCLLNESDTLSLGLSFEGAKDYNLRLSSIKTASDLKWSMDL